MNRNKFMLSILALLVFLRFVLVPWIEWQDEKNIELQTLTKRLVRSEALLAARDEVLAQSEVAKQKSSDLKLGLAITSDTAQYKVEFQEDLQAKLDAMNVQLSSFEWLSEQEIGAFAIKTGRVNVRFKGAVADIVQAHAMLEIDFPGLVVKDLRANWQGPFNEYSVIEMQLLIEVDYLVSKA